MLIAMNGKKRDADQQRSLTCVSDLTIPYYTLLFYQVELVTCYCIPKYNGNGFKNFENLWYTHKIYLLCKLEWLMTL